jgi:acyl dehydratase
MAKQYIEYAMQEPIQEMDVGDKFETKPRVITRTDLELYAISTGDTHPMFLSEEAAQASGWKTQLVPGLLTFSIAVGLLIQAGYIRDVMAFMGADKVRFNAPVYPYDTVKVETEVLSKERTGTGNWICTYSWLVRNQNDEAVAQGENT